MANFECTLEIDLPLYESLSSESSFGKRSESKVEKTQQGVRIKVSAEDITAFTASINYWLRLIKAGSTVFQVI